MSSEVIIRVENVSKKYQLGYRAGPGAGLRHVIQDKLTAPYRLLRKLRHPEAHKTSGPEEFEALRDVSFEVKRGEVLGIIGRNGAGKSTLLKILSRITDPTSGRIGIKGRVASLLEVGTGFHPELTGRENVFLNGAILGMSQAEVKRKFDEIVDFAGVEKFLDTPVKRYSSGMYVRLAFAVAAHLEPEILIVDEVLAVGDIEFQKKCMGKMRDVAGHGRTVLFVSHNISAVSALCTGALLLVKGEVACLGQTQMVTDEYLRPDPSLSAAEVSASAIVNVRVRRTETGEEISQFLSGERVELCFTFVRPPEVTTNLLFTICNAANIGVVSGVFDDVGHSIPAGTTEVTFPLPSNMFNPGDYRLEGVLQDAAAGLTLEHRDSFVTFSVVRTNNYDVAGHRVQGAMRLDSEGVRVV